MKRKTSRVVVERNKPILKKIEKLNKEHPFWGYRRVWAHLVYVDQVVDNKKHVYNLMKQNNLLVKKETKLRAKRTPLKSKPKASRPGDIWGIDGFVAKPKNEPE